VVKHSATRHFNISHLGLHQWCKNGSRTSTARPKLGVRERFLYFLHFILYAYECCMTKLMSVRY